MAKKDEPKKKLSERTESEDKQIRSEAGKKARQTREERIKKWHEDNK